MPETIALARLAISKSRTAMVILIVWAVIGVAIGTAASMVFDGSSGLPILIIITMPAAAWSLGLFDLGSNQDLMDGESGYSHWLLRMPIANWKLALVPIALRTLWICVAWCLFAFAARRLSGFQLPIWSAAAVFSAMGVYVSVITWRPFFSGWWRLAAMLVSGILLYSLLLFVFMAHFDQNEIPILRIPAVKLVISVGGFVAFAIGVSHALRAMKLARTSSDGLVPEMARRGTTRSARRERAVDAGDAPIRDYRSPRRALVGHDLSRLLSTNRRLSIIVGSLYILILSLWLPFKGETVAFVIFFSGYLGLSTAMGALEQPERNKSSLPSYLAASPLTSAEIGFTRAITLVTLSMLGLVVIALILAGWAVWPENRSTFTRWVGQMTSQYGSPVAAYRFIAASVIATIAFVPSRCVGFTSITLTGSTRLQIVAMAGPMLLFLGFVGLVTGWMLKQTDWESAMAGAWYWASWLPTLAVVALVIKFVLVSIASGLSRRHQLITAKTTKSIIAGWIVATLLLSLSLFWLIPDQRVLFSWCLLATALTIPLAHVLILPYSVHINRHR